MKQYARITTVLLFLLGLCLLSAASLAWFGTMRPLSPDLSFSAGGPDDYLLYRITCADDSSVHTVEEVDTVGTDGFSVSDLQLGRINNLSVLTHSNYIYYAVRIPKTDGGTVSLGVGYGDADGDGDHFRIFVSTRDENGDLQYDGEGALVTEPYGGEDLAAIRAIETENAETFLSYTVALSTVAPDGYASIEELDALFSGSEARQMNETDGNGAPLPSVLTMETEALDGEYYYAYVKLEPNVSLYRHFVEYLFDSMPFFLSYEVRVTLEVVP